MITFLSVPPTRPDRLPARQPRTAPPHAETHVHGQLFPIRQRRRRRRRVKRRVKRRARPAVHASSARAAYSGTVTCAAHRPSGTEPGAEAARPSPARPTGGPASPRSAAGGPYRREIAAVSPIGNWDTRTGKMRQWGAGGHPSTLKRKGKDEPHIVGCNMNSISV